MLINEAYFINTENHIHNLTGCIKDDGFLLFMRKMSEKALCNVLGVCLVNEIKEHLDENLQLKEDAPQHIKDLVNGKLYDKTSDCGCSNICSCSSVGTCSKVQWAGLINTDFRCSLIADYVHYEWLLRPTSICCDEDKILINESFKQQKRIDAWNRYAGKVQECNGCSVSLYRFLKDHKESYPEQQGTCLNYKSYFFI